MCDGLGEPYEMGEHQPEKGVIFRLHADRAGKQERTESGETSHDVELRTTRAGTEPDPGVGSGKTASHQGCDGIV
ncbi:hypothetical protein Ae168Ps1_4003c [Pseudonocardia sp. Ae168_Ps1]|nr:hypothetical protein Ae168Ps1_4003c [Pseudonocardia sp. Ae168_Ps1]